MQDVGAQFLISAFLLYSLMQDWVCSLTGWFQTWKSNDKEKAFPAGTSSKTIHSRLSWNYLGSWGSFWHWAGVKGQSIIELPINKDSCLKSLFFHLKLSCSHRFMPGKWIHCRNRNAPAAGCVFPSQPEQHRFYPPVPPLGHFRMGQHLLITPGYSNLRWREISPHHYP